MKNNSLNRQLFFGNIADGMIKLSKIGEIVNNYWLDIKQHFNDIVLDEFVVMPNHVHGIIGVDRVDNQIHGNPNIHDCRDAINRVSTNNAIQSQSHTNNAIQSQSHTDAQINILKINNPMGKNSIGEIIRWYKGRCSYEIRAQYPEINFAWQPRFHDHIIRNEIEFNKIKMYIEDNPKNWSNDALYK